MIAIDTLLDCIRTTYRQQVLPNVADPLAQSFAHSLAVLLDQLANRLVHEEAALISEKAELSALLAGTAVPAGVGDNGRTLARIAVLDREVERLRDEVAARFETISANPAYRDYLRAQTARNEAMYAMQPGERPF